MKRPRWLAPALIILALVAGALYWVTRPPPSLTVVSWGDVYGRAQTLALFHPYTDKSHVDVKVANYGGGLKEISAQVAAGDVQWDVVDLELEDAAAACRQGLLENLQDIELPPGANGNGAQRDFVPGALGPCWVGSVVYSQVIGVDSSRFGDDQPATANDFFDLARFPGARGLRDGSPKYNLELALLADGVKYWQVYAVLGTKEGADRAFAKLDTIKSSIKWWRRAAEPAEMLARGDVAMTTVLNARIFSIDPEPKIRTIWDGQLYQLDVFGIPKGDPNKKLAVDFIRFATGAAPLAQEAELLPYGPARFSALALVGLNPENKAEMLPHLPTARTNFARALAVDPDWWTKHGEGLQARWDSWRKN
ncbi:MAG TPA: extracellular solute-binding protein [Micropepsaceae bacterium]|nr:extracellular solute-binding protein [Micropepsaceae bacterium]